MTMTPASATDLVERIDRAIAELHEIRQQLCPDPRPLFSCTGGGLDDDQIPWMCSVLEHAGLPATVEDRTVRWTAVDGTERHLDLDAVDRWLIWSDGTLSIPD